MSWYPTTTRYGDYALLFLFLGHFYVVLACVNNATTKVTLLSLLITSFVKHVH